MSEIEKAREALVEKLMLEGAGTRHEAEEVVAYFAPFIEASSRAIAREEIETHEAMLLHESIHGNIDAEDTSLGRMTALARRLATALMFLVERCEYRPSGPEYAAMLSTQGGKERKALSGANAVLTEARKAGLIE